MDGRIQIPINNWIKKNYSVDFVDTITQPGVEKIISENIDVKQIKSIEKFQSGEYYIQDSKVVKRQELGIIEKMIDDIIN